METALSSSSGLMGKAERNLHLWQVWKVPRNPGHEPRVLYASLQDFRRIGGYLFEVVPKGWHFSPGLGKPRAHPFERAF